MSFVGLAHDAVAAAGASLEDLGLALRSANAAAAAQTTAFAAPAADEVSQAISALLRAQAQEFQALSARAADFHDAFVSLLNGGAAQYLGTELANAGLANELSAPAQALSGALGVNSAEPWSFSQAQDGWSVTVTGDLTYTVPMLAADIQVTGGSVIAPSEIPLLYGLAGPAYTSAASLTSSLSAFDGAVQTGNVPGAAAALLTAPGNALGAALFGQTTITYADPTGDAPPYSVTITVGGLFAPAEPVLLTVPQSTFTEGVTTYTVEPSQVYMQGTQFGGLGQVLLRTILGLQ